MTNTPPRIALLGLSIECNAFAPIATKADFTGRYWLEGAEIVDDARQKSSRALGEMPGEDEDRKFKHPVPLPWTGTAGRWTRPGTAGDAVGAGFGCV